ncbi:MAG TPA: cupredoxin domain-containing protein [Rhizomicrobium sp.]|jgi:plastocyanin
MDRIVALRGVLSFFVAFAAGVTAAQAGAPTPVSVSLENYAYEPENLVLKAGETYRLHFINSSNKDHDFNAPKFFGDSTVSPDDRAKIVNGGVEVKAGRAVDVSMTVSHPGEYPVTCTHFMHADMGMEGSVTVK